MSPVEPIRRRTPAREFRLSIVAAALLVMMGGSFPSGVHAQATRPSAAKPDDKQAPSSTASPPMVPGDARDPESATYWVGGRYRLTASDVIEVKFPHVPEFDQVLTVQPDGYVSLHSVGDVRVHAARSQAPQQRVPDTHSARRSAELAGAHSVG